MAKKPQQPSFMAKEIKEYKPDYQRYPKPVPITMNHRKYHNLLKDKGKRYVVADGYAGTSKSICAVYYAVQAVLKGEAKGIYFVRANEGIGKDIGFLKGTEMEKTNAHDEAIMFIRQLIL